jgi:hypothetical protein
MAQEPPPEWLERESALDEIYMCLLGWFVHAFASTESFLHRLLVYHSGLSPTEGAALFSGLRMKSAMEALNRLFDTQGNDLEKGALSKPFAQLSEINSVRDEDDLGELFVSNAERKHIPSRATIRKISSTDLHNMTLDLREIEVHFAASMLRSGGIRRHKTTALYTSRLAEPWRHKPSSRPPPQEKSRKKNQARATRPKAS